jgi:hypothetical protein
MERSELHNRSYQLIYDLEKAGALLKEDFRRAGRKCNAGSFA